MGFVKRHASTLAKVSPPAFDELKKQFLFDVKCLIAMEEIPNSLVINSNLTGNQYVPASSWTMEKQGMKQVEIEGLNNKRLITAVVAVTKMDTFYHHKSSTNEQPVDVYHLQNFQADGISYALKIIGSMKKQPYPILVKSCCHM